MIKSRRVRRAGYVACMGATLNAYRILMRKLKGELPLGKLERVWEYNIKMDLIRDGVVWTALIWFRIGTSGGIL
jgi:hypothetical protein